MVRLADLTEAERQQLLQTAERAPRFDTTPWATGPALARRRVALVTTAGLHRREDRPFAAGSGANEYRVIPRDTPTAELAMSHISVNYDRTGFRSDPNVVFPLARLIELQEEGVIGSVGDYHYSFMGAPFPPTSFEAKARELAGLLRRDGVDAVLLTPV